MERIVVLTGDTNFSVRKGIYELAGQFPFCEILVVLHQPKKSLKTIFRNQCINLKRNGWRWIPYLIKETLRLVLMRLHKPNWHSEKRPGKFFDGGPLFGSKKIRLRQVNDIHDLATIELVRKFKPDLGISLAAPILKQEVFAIPEFGTINLHKGKVPDYRGMPPVFWEFWNQEDSVGCTIHKVAKKLDAGDILLEKSVRRERYSTIGGIRLALDELGIQMMCQAVRDIAEGKANWCPQPKGGKTFRKPNLAQIADMEGRQRTFTKGEFLRLVLKESVAATYLFGCRSILRILYRVSGNRNVVVLLYHRVSDEFRDSVTVGLQQFDQQMAYIAKNYPVASIDEIIKGCLPGKTRGKPIVAVSFDDGYRDNYDNAVPILLRHQIPAAFFVSTGMIDRRKGFDHDIKKLGFALPNMTWDQLREMHGWGFTIGSHTVSHINCAKADPSLLWKQLIESRDKLIAELNLREVIFAYPFGKRSDINQDALELVKKAGYVGCLSAYGGVNRGDIDRFNILRMGVSFNFQRLRFAARIEGW